ncbi:MAG: glucuronyl hydrolase, partial [Bacteroidaceae bacterium]|nr:glucuronyl hydrolase [Bacteroidaceae bacterium]
MKMIFVGFVMIMYLCCSATCHAQPLDVNHELEYCHAQVLRTLAQLRSDDGSIDYSMTPRNIGANDSLWTLRSVKTPEEWCAGFFPGILWMDGDSAEASAFTREL